MPANDFLSWSTGPGNNAMSQTDYASNAAVPLGVSDGIADPTLYNKQARQAAFVAHCVGQFIAANQLNDVLDDGIAANFIGNFETALVDFLSGVTTSSATRIRLKTDTLLYVDGASGADLPTKGLTAGAGAFKTAQYACDFAKNYYDWAGFNLGLSTVGSIGGALIAGPMVGQSSPFVIAASGATTMGAINGCGLETRSGAKVELSGNITMSATGTNIESQGCGVLAGDNSEIDIGGGVTFGACAIAGGQAVSGGNISFPGAGTRTVSAGAPYFLLISNNGKVYLYDSPTIAFSGNPAFSVATIACFGQSSIALSPGTILSGAATGVRYLVADSSLINTFGGGPGFIPGNASGIQTGYGIYQ